jgi:hypothetical protein
MALLRGTVEENTNHGVRCQPYGLMLSRSIYPVLTVGAKHNNPKDFILFIGLEDYGERGPFTSFKRALDPLKAHAGSLKMPLTSLQAALEL